MAEREYLDVDIPLNLKQGGIVGEGTGQDVVPRAIESFRDEANRIIRAHVERYHAQGWTPERSIDLLHIYQDKRLKYRQTPFMRKVVLISARITFHREAE